MEKIHVASPSTFSKKHFVLWKTHSRLSLYIVWHFVANPYSRARERNGQKDCTLDWRLSFRYTNGDVFIHWYQYSVVSVVVCIYIFTEVSS
jgi:hypothetical protein